MKNLLIIGCGLLGSSLARKISKKKMAKKIFVFEKSKANLNKIIKLKLPVTIAQTLKDGVVNSDLIIFCTPMSEYKGLILKINKFISPKTLITDIGSSKIETSKIIKKFLSSFLKKVGSKTVIMNSEKHDKIFSITSHLPHLIAYNLVKSAQDFEKIQKFDLIKYSAGGLRDFSRIAASNEIMWRDIFFYFIVNVIKAIDLFIKNLNAFKKDILIKNNKSILKKLIQTKKVRSKIIKLKQDINKPDFGRN